MADVRPFRGLRYDPAKLGDHGAVLCPPYDVIGAEDERHYRDRHPSNAVALELSTASVAAKLDDRYARAAATLQTWEDTGVLVRDDAPAYYLHECTYAVGADRRVRRELIAAIGLEPWDRRVVLPHEHTYPRAKADRLQLLQATRTNISPILMFYSPETADDALASAWRWAEANQSTFQGVDGEGTGHRLWVLREASLLGQIQASFASRQLFIADGHHRYETALHFAQQGEARPAVGQAPGEGPGSVMAHLVAADDPGLLVLPIHRILAGLDGLEASDFEERLSADFHPEYFPVWEDAPPEQVDAFMQQLVSRGELDQALGVYGPDPSLFAILARRNRNALPETIPIDRHASWRGLDVVLAESAVIRPLLAERQLDPEVAIEYTRDPQAAFQAVRRGQGQVAVLLNPTRVEQVAAVALAGERMPEKSTYFYPKAPTGLVFRPLD